MRVQSASLLLLRILLPYIDETKGCVTLGAFKLDHLQSVKLILSQKFYTFLPFILVGPIPFCPRERKKERSRGRNLKKGAILFRSPRAFGPAVSATFKFLPKNLHRRVVFGSFLYFATYFVLLRQFGWMSCLLVSLSNLRKHFRLQDASTIDRHRNILKSWI